MSDPLLPRTDPALSEDVKTKEAKRKLLIGAGLCFAFMLAEIIGGYLAGSLAVMTDAAHMLSDVAGFLVSVMALFLSSRTADAQYTFGYHRAEVLGALASIMVVWVMTGILLFEAVQRLITPEIVDGPLMFAVSVVGVVMNVVLMQVLGHGDAHGGHDHGHSHGHGHAHGPKPMKVKTAYKPPEVPSGSHGHDAEHGHDCESHGHTHTENSHADKSHGHDHAPAEMPRRMKEAVAKQAAVSHSHGHAEKSHGHDHAETSHGHDHAEKSHGHGHVHGGGCCGHDDDDGEHDDHDDEEEKNLAVRAAMAHVIGDILSSLGVCLSAALIWGFHDRWLDPQGVSYWYRADPICTFLFSILVIWSTWSTVSEGVHVLMAGVPSTANAPLVQRRLRDIPQVLDVHDLVRLGSSATAACPAPSRLATT